MEPVRSMFRDAIVGMAPYVPGEQPKPGERLIKLNTNENPYPPSPRVRAAIIKAVQGDALRLYPRPMADEFIEAASRCYRMPQEMILAGNGSDELLAMLFRAVLDPGDTVAYAVPTYSLYDTLASIEGARVAAVEMKRDFAFPAGELTRAQARLTIVCNPNSPTGTIISGAVLSRMAEEVSPRLLVIDEAYVDFADRHSMGLVRKHANVIVLRTLSKSFSLAGMRLGLCFAQPPVIQQLLKVKDSYNLSRVAQAAGAAALRSPQWAARNAERIRHTRRDTSQALRALGFEVPPSSANFVLARLAGHDLSELAAQLRRSGILVRYFASPLLYDCLRISIGKPAEMKALLGALKRLVPSLLARGNGRAGTR
jgi:histidinol-phosphate aminotransferase